MVDWKRLGLAVLCTAILFGVCIVLVLLSPDVLLALGVVAFVCLVIFSFYKTLGDISYKDRNGTDKD